MQFAAGARLGPYEIQSALGAGGMGEVYRARDTRLDRTVAIKVGPQREIYVQPFPGPGGKRQVSADGGTEPLWSPRGNELFYRRGDQMMVVPVAITPTFAPGAPRILFEGRYDRIDWNERNYDVTQDGSRFLMLAATEESRPTPVLRIVLNWFAELQQKVPAP